MSIVNSAAAICNHSIPQINLAASVEANSCSEQNVLVVWQRETNCVHSSIQEAPLPWHGDALAHVGLWPDVFQASVASPDAVSATCVHMDIG